MEVDVVLLDRFAAIVEFFVFFPVLGGEFPTCKGSYRFFIRQDAIHAVAVSSLMPGVFFLDKFLFGPVFATAHGWPPVNGNLLRLGDLHDMGVQLVGQDTHDAIGEFSETHRPEELDHAAWKEQPQDVSPQDDSIKATVFELDILGELLHKGIIHGQCPFYGFFAEHPI